MAFFKFRKGGDAQSTTTPPPAAQSIETLRKRARHRLVGAAVLVLLGVVGFPLLFDSQPRPIAVDIPIDIPDKAKVRPLPAPVTTVATQASGVIIEEKESASSPAQAASALPAAAQGVSAASAADSRSVEAVLSPKAQAKPESKPEVKAEAKPDAKADSKPAAKAETKSSTPSDAKVDKTAHKDKTTDAAKAQALLDGKTSTTSATSDKKPSDPKAAVDAGRFVVQVGAYSDSPKAHEARMKVERAGHKTYTQVVGSKDQQRIRVRVGPFATKAEAQKVAEKLKKLGLPAAILEL